LKKETVLWRHKRRRAAGKRPETTGREKIKKMKEDPESSKQSPDMARDGVFVPLKSVELVSRKGYVPRKITTTKGREIEIDSGLVLSIFGREPGEIIEEKAGKKRRFEIAGFGYGALWLTNQEDKKTYAFRSNSTTSFLSRFKVISTPSNRPIIQIKTPTDEISLDQISPHGPLSAYSVSTFEKYEILGKAGMFYFVRSQENKMFFTPIHELHIVESDKEISEFDTVIWKGKQGTVKAVNNGKAIVSFENESFIVNTTELDVIKSQIPGKIKRIGGKDYKICHEQSGKMVFSQKI